MSKLYLIIIIIFFHIVDDYYLQGWLSSAKQKKWWKSNAPEKLYKYDYIVALFMHSFSWSFMIMLPLAFYFNFELPVLFFFLFALNIIIHAWVDHLKANKLKINLIIDQSIHLIQIIATALLLLFL